VVTGACLFGGWLSSETSEIPLSCLAVLLLLWPAFRFSPRETSTAVLIFAAIAIWGSTAGHGPFADEPGTQSILMLQGFVGLVAVSGLGVAADVAHRRGMRSGLHRYKMAALQTADHWIITDKNGVIRELNPSFERVTGYLEKELIGKTPRILKSGKHDKAFYKNMWDRILTGESYTGVVVNRKKNGELFYEMKTVTPIRDEDGEITAFLSIGKDITELKLAEQRLATTARELERINGRLLASEQALLQHTHILESVFNGMDEGVIVADENGRFVMFNDAAERILGIGPISSGPEGWVARYGVYLPDTVTPFPTEELPLVRALKGDKTSDVEMFIKNPTLERGRWISVSGRPLGEGEVMGGVIVVRDISQQKAVERVENELRATREEFEIARKIQARLFPESAPEIPGIDIGGASRPAVATGGDYFDYIGMPDGWLGIVIGDVCGHGLGPSLLMASVRGHLQALVQSGIEPREILNITNRLIESDTDDEKFVTMILSRLDPRTKSFEYVSAGHTTCYVLDRDNNVKRELESTGPPLGVLPDVSFENSDAVALEDGDVVLLLTDGVIEAECEDCPPFGVDRALDVVRRYREEKAIDIVAALHEAVADYCDMECQDDVTSIVIKVGA
ncbi:MAG: SpoIIE family protein phosphatase, partial [bacterium]